MPKYFSHTQLSENIAETPEGFLLCLNVPITRTGELLYGEGETPLETDDDGQIMISRTDKDIFDEKAIASFEGKPVTINHPNDFVTPHTWKDLAKGHMQNVRPGKSKISVDGNEESVLLADLLIKDFLAIQLVKNGLREVSLGYEAEYEQTGEGKGRQLSIRGNHIALVDAGRAGEYCAVTDNKKKGESTMSKLAELLKKLHKVADEEMPEKKDEKAKDADESEKKDDKKDDKAKDESAPSYDDMMGMMKDMKAAIDEFMSKGKDAESEKKDDDKKEDDSKDADEEKKDDKKEESKDEEGSIEDRLTALETALAKLLEGQSESSEDEEMAEDEESEDESTSSFTGDTIARAEILAPGIKKSKDMKTVALKTFFATKEGKGVIEALTGGKPTFDSAEKIEHLFVAASEVVKHKRGTGLEGTKNAKSFDSSESEGATQPMSADDVNKKMAAHYGLKN